MRKILGFAFFVVACGGSVASPTDAGDDGDAGPETGVVCECSGPAFGGGLPGVTVIPGSASGPCDQPSCEDQCGNVFPAVCSSLGEWTCGGMQMPYCPSDAGPD